MSGLINRFVEFMISGLIWMFIFIALGPHGASQYYHYFLEYHQVQKYHPSFHATRGFEYQYPSNGKIIIHRH